MEQPSIIAQLLPMLVVQIPYALFAGAIAHRLHESRVTWVIVSLVPLLGFLFMVYVFYRIVARVLDRLDEINAKIAF